MLSNLGRRLDLVRAEVRLAGYNQVGKNCFKGCWSDKICPIPPCLYSCFNVTGGIQPQLWLGFHTLYSHLPLDCIHLKCTHSSGSHCPSGTLASNCKSAYRPHVPLPKHCLLLHVCACCLPVRQAGPHLQFTDHTSCSPPQDWAHKLVLLGDSTPATLGHSPL